MFLYIYMYSYMKNFLSGVYILIIYYKLNNSLIKYYASFAGTFLTSFFDFPYI